LDFYPSIDLIFPYNCDYTCYILNILLFHRVSRVVCYWYEDNEQTVFLVGWRNKFCVRLRQGWEILKFFVDQKIVIRRLKDVEVQGLIPKKLKRFLVIMSSTHAPQLLLLMKISFSTSYFRLQTEMSSIECLEGHCYKQYPKGTKKYSSMVRCGANLKSDLLWNPKPSWTKLWCYSIWFLQLDVQF